MPKKRDGKPTWRKSKSRYFPDTLSGQTIDPMRIKLNHVVLCLNVAGGLKFLDSGALTQQAVTNTLIEWAWLTLESKGTEALENELGPAMKELEVLVAQRMLADGKDLAPEYRPEGVGVKADEMTPSRIRSIREGLGLTIGDASGRIGVCSDEWSKWERDPSDVGAKRPCGPAVILLRQMECEIEATRKG